MVAAILMAVPPLTRPLMTVTDGEAARPVPSQGEHRVAVYALRSLQMRLDCGTQLSAAAVPDRLADCSVGRTTMPDHMQL